MSAQQQRKSRDKQCPSQIDDVRRDQVLDEIEDSRLSQACCEDNHKQVGCEKLRIDDSENDKPRWERKAREQCDEPRMRHLR